MHAFYRAHYDPLLSDSLDSLVTGPGHKEENHGLLEFIILDYLNHFTVE